MENKYQYLSRNNKETKELEEKLNAFTSVCKIESKGTLLVERLQNKAGVLSISPKDKASEITGIGISGTANTGHIEIMEADSAGLYLVIDNRAYQVDYKFSKTPSQ